MRYLKIANPDGDFVIDHLSNLGVYAGELEHEEPGNRWTIEVVEMPEEIFEMLPEGPGWV